jgi:hypothetical protein
MKTRLLVFAAMGLGLQGIAHATNPDDDPVTLDRAQPVDEVWGIGVRTAHAEVPVAPVREATAAANTFSELESAFWACDYVATTRGVDATPVGICNAVYDELKALKFDGDFDELLAWWKENKPAEHERLAREERDAAVEHVDHR